MCLCGRCLQVSPFGLLMRLKEINMELNTISGNEVTEIEEATSETELSEVPMDSPQDILDDNENIADDTQDFSNTVDDAESVSDSDSVEEIADAFNGESYSEVSGNDVYIIETTTEEIPFLEKPINDYTTEQGLLLVILVLVFGVFLLNLFK